MNVLGVIAEYNPFHNGHAWHLDQAKYKANADFTIAVMSGNFVQRGEPAIFHKWHRAELAILSGIDLVLELPFVYAVRSAQYFAEGGVNLLNNLGLISHIAFGAETADPKVLQAIATTMFNPATIKHIKANMKTGITYAKALGQTISELLDISPNIIMSPNNILAVEYLRALQKNRSDIIPIIIPRYEAHYHDPEIIGPIASATAIRSLLKISSRPQILLTSVLPSAANLRLAELIETGTTPTFLEQFSNLILYRLRTSNLYDLAQLPDASEGLHYKLKKSSLISNNIESLINNIKSKRYTRTRIQRILIHSLLGTNNQALQKFDLAGPQYARVLAFNEKGRSLLQKINQRTKMPVITKTAKFLTTIERDNNANSVLQQVLAIDTLTSDIYALATQSSTVNGSWDFVKSPRYIR